MLPILLSSATKTGSPSMGGRFFLICLLVVAVCSCNASDTADHSRGRRVKVSPPAPGPVELKAAAELEAVNIDDCRAMLQNATPPVTSDMVITVRAAVDAMGVVQSVRILTSIYPHKRFESCVLRTLKQARISPPAKHLSIDAGFALKK